MDVERERKKNATTLIIIIRRRREAFANGKGSKGRKWGRTVAPAPWLIADRIFNPNQ